MSEISAEDRAAHAKKVKVNPEQEPCPTCGHTEWYRYYGNMCSDCIECRDKYHSKHAISDLSMFGLKR